jgi:DNA adenine methylase
VSATKESVENPDLAGSDLVPFDVRTRPQAEPFVKWAGGKTVLLPKLRKYFPRQFRTYFEPFLGGGAVFFNLRPQSAVLSDFNEELVTTYKVVQNRLPELVRSLTTLSEQYRKSPKRTFDIVKREVIPVKDDEVGAAARFLLLNRTCYNGLYRVNSSGEFNVPWSGAKKARICDEKGLSAASAALSGVVIRHLDYAGALNLVEDGDFVYLDPPYHPLSETANFTGYTINSFNEEAQVELAAAVARLSARVRCKILMSSSKVKFLEDLYRKLGFEIDSASGPRRISCNPKTRGNVRELIIRNYEMA